MPFHHTQSVFQHDANDKTLFRVSPTAPSSYLPPSHEAGQSEVDRPVFVLYSTTKTSGVNNPMASSFHTKQEYPEGGGGDGGDGDGSGGGGTQ